MKIELDSPDSTINTIKSYSIDGVIIKNTLYQGNIIVSPNLLIEDWEAKDINNIDLDHLNAILETQPELILFGTGDTLIFPDNDILDSIRIQNIGVEVMDTGAACRAYNFIAGEGRLVTAALFQAGS